MLSILKTKKRILILSLFLLFFLALAVSLSSGKTYDKNELRYGVTFSQKKAEELGFDWRAMYLEMMEDLQPKMLRLSAYWDEVEPAKDEYVWADLDWQLEVASQYDTKVVLAVGGRLPRWPECHYPRWAENLTKELREKEVLEYIGEAVRRYRDFKVIGYWQVENEPFLSHFGECPELDSEFLDREIALVNKLDSRKVIVTDSGEISFWIPAAKRADIFGTTMYRDTYSQHFKTYIHYPILPSFFKFKKNITSLFADPEDWVVIELQAEPWCPVPYQYASREDREKTMSYEKFKEMIEFARQAGFRTFYLWGIEWWYWEKYANNDPRVWEYAKELFEKSSY